MQKTLEFYKKYQQNIPQFWVTIAENKLATKSMHYKSRRQSLKAIISYNDTCAQELAEIKFIASIMLSLSREKKSIYTLAQTRIIEKPVPTTKTTRQVTLQKIEENAKILQQFNLTALEQDVCSLSPTLKFSPVKALEHNPSAITADSTILEGNPKKT